jgi:pseudoazurin
MKRLALTLLLILPCLVAAKQHQVKLLTADASGQTMIMQPDFLQIAVGDSVEFIPSDVTHNAQSIVSPNGAKAFNTAMGQTVVIKFDQEGAYLYKCTPHFALGMLGVVQVGKAVNKADVSAQWDALQAGVVMNKERVAATLAKMTN